VYGLGRSEELLGKFARQNPKAGNVEIATKFAALPWRTKPSDVVEAAKRSTERLGRPIDLYQVHFPNAWCNARYWDGLADCVDRGLVKKVGVSNYGVDAMRACSARLQERGTRLTSNQVQLSLLYPFALDNGLLEACRDLDAEMLAYSPLGLGMLTGKFSETYLPAGPRRQIAQQYVTEPAFNALIATMRDVATEVGGPTDPAQVALGWCMAKGASVIPGARNIRQAESNLRPRKFKLSAAQVARLDEAAARVPKAVLPEANPFPKKDVFTGLTMYDS
jgi:pyridoxine 4-dehydrogenase